MSEIDKRKKEVRERMEAQARNNKKKGFMTPERKKKLRVLFYDLQLMILDFILVPKIKLILN